LPPSTLVIRLLGEFMTPRSESNQTVLVVEDSARDVELLQAAIRKANCACKFHFVKDGSEAIAYLNGDPPFEDRSVHPTPRVILLDLGLRRVDGFEVLKWIRASDRCENVKIMVWSGWQNVKNAELTRQLGANIFILKMATPDVYANVVSGISMALDDSR
jgi:CheY-like chemotaxis protein